MAKYTTRDYIWNFALKARDPFTADDLVERIPHDVSRKTVRDCLNTMTEMHLLERYDIDEDGVIHYDKREGTTIPRIE